MRKLYVEPCFFAKQKAAGATDALANVEPCFFAKQKAAGATDAVP